MSETKVVVIGLDAPIVKRVKMYAEQGLLPAFKRLMENGVWCEHCLEPHPTITPPNWTTIATGASVGTHGITCFHQPSKEDDLGKIPQVQDGPSAKVRKIEQRNVLQAYDSRQVKAEYIWEAAERIGKRTIVLNYPTSWPPRMKLGLQVAGGGLHPVDWRWDSLQEHGECLPGMGWRVNLADQQCITTADLPLADVVNVTTPNNWSGELPQGASEAVCQIGKYNSLYQVTPIELYLLIDPDRGLISGHTARDTNSKLFELSEDQWSNRLVLQFDTEQGRREACFMVKCEKLAKDGTQFRLYFTSFCCLQDGTYPLELAGELEKQVDEGLPVQGMENAYSLGWISLQSWSELMDIENRWLAAATQFMMKNKPWDIFYMHAHASDHLYHAIINELEPTLNPDPASRAEFEKVEQQVYQSYDRMIEQICQAAGSNAIVTVVSDHGACPSQGANEPGYGSFSATNILADAGLLLWVPDSEVREIDHEHSLAIPERSVYVYVNLKSRYTHGCVEDSQYKEVQDKIIEALLSYRDPLLGKSPFAFVLRREEARLIGLHGPNIGDVVFGLIAESAREHGRQIASGEYGIGSMKSLLLMSGPGLKKGAVLDRTVNIMDLVPTLCYLADLPFPAQCEGAIIYQAMESPDKHLTQQEKIRKLEQTLRGQQSLTHSY